MPIKLHQKIEKAWGYGLSEEIVVGLMKGGCEIAFKGTGKLSIASKIAFHDVVI